jgi:Fe-S-cluster formation regulator IscX/YfhJ
MKLAHFLLAFKSVNPLLVGFGDVRKAIDELEGFGEPAGGLFLQVTV